MSCAEHHVRAAIEAVQQRELDRLAGRYASSSRAIAQPTDEPVAGELGGTSQSCRHVSAVDSRIKRSS